MNIHMHVLATSPLWHAQKAAGFTPARELLRITTDSPENEPKRAENLSRARP